MTVAISVKFVPGPRLIDGTDLNNLVNQANAAFVLAGAYPVLGTLATVGAGTITAALIVGQLLARSGSTAAYTDTTDTAANIIAAAGSTLPVGACFFFTYQNTVAFAATIAGGTSVTMSGNVVVSGLTWATYLVTIASSTTVTMAYITGGQLSPLPLTSQADDSGQATTMGLTGLVGAQVNNINMTGATPGARPLPIATQITAAIPNCRPGMSFTTTFRNPSSSTLELSGLTGTAFSGTAKVQTLTARTFNVTVESLASVTFTNLTSSTI